MYFAIAVINWGLCTRVRGGQTGLWLFLNVHNSTYIIIKKKTNVNDNCFFFFYIKTVYYQLRRTDRRTHNIVKHSCACAVQDLYC